MAELVSAQRAATKENVQRKQARTDGERDDSENEESDDESIEDDADDVPYNPKNLPLGWDGKVISRLVKHLTNCMSFLADPLLALQTPRAEHQLQL